MHSITSIQDAEELLKSLPQHYRQSDRYVGDTLIHSSVPTAAQIPIHSLLIGNSTQVNQFPNKPISSQPEAEKIIKIAERLASDTNLDRISQEIGVSFGFEVETKNDLPKEDVKGMYILLEPYGYKLIYNSKEREIKTPPTPRIMKSLRDALYLQKILSSRGYTEFSKDSLHTTIGGIQISPYDTRIMYATVLLGISGQLGINERLPTNSMLAIVEVFPKYQKIDLNNEQYYCYYPYHKPRNPNELTGQQNIGIELRYTPNIFGSLRSATEYLKYIQCFAIGLRSSQKNISRTYTGLFNEHIKEIEEMSRDTGLTRFISNEEIPLYKFMNPDMIRITPDDPYQRPETLLESAGKHQFNFLIGEATLMAHAKDIRDTGHNLMRKYIHQVSSAS